MQLWAPGGTGEAGEHVAFRGRFDLEAETHVEVRSLGASVFVVHLDGAPLVEGPSRFTSGRPEHETSRVRLAAGEHVLAVQVVYHGMSTEVLPDLLPFLWVEVQVGTLPLELKWRCLRLGGYRTNVRRINPNLGWAERCDTREVPAWHPPGFDDTGWEPVELVDRELAPPQPVSLAGLRHAWCPATAMGNGTFRDRFHLPQDDPPTCFALREFDPDPLLAEGTWLRFDLGRVRLGRPVVELDVPPGTEIEIGYAEGLLDGRVVPWISWSNGLSCNLDAYVARGGRQVLGPVSPRGLRFLEVHIRAATADVVVYRAGVVERSAYPEEPVGRLACGDPLLERIWRTGLDTLRACAEDAVIDCPTRERGQWIGDIVVGMEIAAVAHADLRLFRRGLVQSADCADERGLVSGNAPGECFMLSTYAASWVGACVRYVELTGDVDLLAELWPAAQRNLQVFRAATTADGVQDSLPWGFVDWGYARPDGPADMALTLLVLGASRAGLRWAGLLGEPADDLVLWSGQLEHTVRHWLSAAKSWEDVGYHCTALALLEGVVKESAVPDAADHLERHLGRCFPVDVTAPRLTGINVTDSRLVTPYFSHYALEALARVGRVEAVLDQHRAGWGWLLGQGATTWWEVFDPGWSHCHQWSGAPTWQLSRYLLGLQPRWDRGRLHYDLDLRPGSRSHAEGRLPLPHPYEGWIDVTWVRDSDGTLNLQLAPTVPITVRVDGVDVRVEGSWITSIC